MTSKRLTPEIPDADEVRYKPRIDAMIAEIDCILKGMKRKQARIDRLRERTRARLAKLDALKR